MGQVLASPWLNRDSGSRPTDGQGCSGVPFLTEAPRVCGMVWGAFCRLTARIRMVPLPIGAYPCTFNSVPLPQPGCFLGSPVTDHLWPCPCFMWKHKLKQPLLTALRVESSSGDIPIPVACRSPFTSSPQWSRHSRKGPRQLQQLACAWFSGLRTLACCVWALASGLCVNN